MIRIYNLVKGYLHGTFIKLWFFILTLKYTWQLPNFWLNLILLTSWIPGNTNADERRKFEVAKSSNNQNDIVFINQKDFIYGWNWIIYPWYRLRITSYLKLEHIELRDWREISRSNPYQARGTADEKKLVDFAMTTFSSNPSTRLILTSCAFMNSCYIESLTHWEKFREIFLLF